MRKPGTILLASLLTCLLLAAASLGDARPAGSHSMRSIPPTAVPASAGSAAEVSAAEASAHFAASLSVGQAAPQTPGQTAGSPAMASPGYRLDWFTPLTTGSGASAGSPHYNANTSLGQTASTISTSPTYQVRMGYWGGLTNPNKIWLPLIRR